jgi:hypothetical protein
MDERIFQCRAKYPDGRSEKIFHQQKEGREILQEQQEGQSDERHSQGGDLERAWLWLDRHPAPAFLFEHDPFGNPVSAFPDHALELGEVIPAV